MDLIRRIGEKRSLTKEKFKQMQEDDRLNTMLEERKKSSNQRELEEFEKREDEKQIKIVLDKVRKQKQSEFFSGKSSIINQKTTILKDNKKLLKGGKSILLQKNIFLDNKTNIPLTDGRHMFFK